VQDENDVYAKPCHPEEMEPGLTFCVSQSTPFPKAQAKSKRLDYCIQSLPNSSTSGVLIAPGCVLTKWFIQPP